MNTYKGDEGIYISNSKASILFTSNTYTTRNEAEEELMQERMREHGITQLTENKKEENKKVIKK